MILNRRTVLTGTAALALAASLPALAAPQPVYEVIGFKGEHPLHTLMLVRIEGDTAHPLFKLYDNNSMATAGSEVWEHALTYVMESDGNFNANTLRDFKVRHHGGENRVCWADHTQWNTFRTAEYGTLKLA